MRDNAMIQELAQRIYDYLAPWERVDTSVDEIADNIRNKPENVIEWLMDILEGC